jgi:hypothetical protein
MIVLVGLRLIWAYKICGGSSVLEQVIESVAEGPVVVGRGVK